MLTICESSKFASLLIFTDNITDHKYVGLKLNVCLRSYRNAAHITFSAVADEPRDAPC